MSGVRIPSPPPSLLSPVDRFFRDVAPTGAGDAVLAAFSGGPDSTALLILLRAALAPRGATLRALHLDHGLDPGSRDRAAAALHLARALDVPCEVESLWIARDPGVNLEAAARDARYAALAAHAAATGCRWIATAHHADDQAETVLLRLASGSGIAGLAGIQPRRGPVVRPLLGLRRGELAALVAAAGLEPVRDPTNRDLRRLRNRLRDVVAPRLAVAEELRPTDLVRLAEVARRAAAGVENRLAAALDVRPLPSPAAPSGGASCDLAALRALPETLLEPALALLHRAAGAPYPPGADARRELARQLARGSGRGPRVACDAGRGWGWIRLADRLAARPLPPRPAGPFTYTLKMPGVLEIAELALRLRVRRETAFEPAGEPSEVRFRARLSLPLGEGEAVTVRSRRTGDRIRIAPAAPPRRLDRVLAEHGVPGAERPRLPLVCVDEQVAWVPGVAVDAAFRPDAGTREVWVAEVTSR